jgi:hypothetical protein
LRYVSRPDGRGETVVAAAYAALTSLFRISRRARSGIVTVHVKPADASRVASEVVCSTASM